MQTLEGGLEISGSAFFRLNNSTARNITLNSTLTGSGNLGLIQRGTLTLGGTGNTFGGLWTIGGTATVLASTPLQTTYTNTSTLVSTLFASSAQSLGLGSSVTVDAFGIFRTGYNWETSGALILNTNSVTELDFDWTVGSLTINGDVLGPGTYSYATLNSSYDAFFSNDVTGGSITVVPEPDVYGLVLGSLGLLGLRRRRQS